MQVSTILKEKPQAAVINRARDRDDKRDLAGLTSLEEGKHTPPLKVITILDKLGPRCTKLKFSLSCRGS